MSEGLYAILAAVQHDDCPVLHLPEFCLRGALLPEDTPEMAEHVARNILTAYASTAPAVTITSITRL